MQELETCRRQIEDWSRGPLSCSSGDIDCSSGGDGSGRSRASPRIVDEDVVDDELEGVVVDEEMATVSGNGVNGSTV